MAPHGPTTAPPPPPGHTLAFLSDLGHAPPAHLLQDFCSALRVFSADLISLEPYPRPPPPLPSDSLGKLWVRPIEQRLVPVESDGLAHAAAALRLVRTLPEPSFRSHLHEEEPLSQVFLHMLRQPDLELDRRCRIASFQYAVDLLQPFTTWVEERLSPAVRASRRCISVPVCALLVEGLRVWPDLDLPRLLFCGFDSRDAVPDSGIFRPCERPAAYTPRSLATGKAFPPSPVGQPAQPPFLSGPAWVKFLSGSTASRARHAEQAGGPALLAVRAIEQSVLNEIRACPPTMSPPISLPKLYRYIPAHGGHARVRPIRAFNRFQGVRADGTPKCRRIDDCKEGGQNGACTTLETVFHVSFEWPALAARLLLQTAASIGLPLDAVPPLGLLLEDMQGAYRQLTNKDSDWNGMVAFWYSGALDNNRLGPPGVRFSKVLGHVFGSSASVLNFERYARLLTAVLRRKFGVPATNYVDDQFAIDLATAGPTARCCIWALHAGLGSALDPAKSHHVCFHRPVHPVLGVEVDLTPALTHGYVLHRATPKRCANILALLAAAKESGVFSSADVRTCRGKLGFCCQASAFRVGRAAFGILRGHERRGAVAWSTSLDMLHAFLAVVLPSLPPLIVRMAPDARSPVHLYTDAAYRRSPPGQPDDGGTGVLGVFIADPEPAPLAPSRRHARLRVPQWVWHALAPDHVTRIMQAELLAMISVYWSLPDLLRHRAVLHWCDNTAALTAATGGGAASFAGADLLGCMLHLALLHLRCDVHFDWVPSAANPADWPTRPEKEHLIPHDSVPFSLCLPPDFLFRSLMDPAAIAMWRRVLSP